MKRQPAAILAFILSMGLLITGCYSPPTVDSPTQAPQVGRLAPDFQLPNLEGQYVSLSDYRGTPVMLNFWATWCRPCRYEMPSLQEIDEEWSGKGLVLLTVNLRESSGTVNNFLKAYNLSLLVLLDTDGNITNKYNITGIPTTFFIDKDGIIQDKVVGSFANKEQIESYLKKIVP